MEKGIAVVYLIWLEYDIGLMKKFINSYKTFDSGAPHVLHLVFNGYHHPSQLTEYNNFIDQEMIRCEKHFLSGGQDIEAYFYVSKQIKAEYLMFLNSYSVFNASNWLKFYIDNYAKDVGAIGATGSFQSYFSSVFVKKQEPQLDEGLLQYYFRKSKLYFKAIFYWRFLFSPFPNIHLRTNAFFLKRDIFLSLYQFKIITKLNAYQFESGRKGMSAQLMQRGYKLLVLDRNGKTYEPSEWKQSRTFWTDDQELLLVSDNQTEGYQNSNQAERKELTLLAWGKST